MLLDYEMVPRARSLASYYEPPMASSDALLQTQAPAPATQSVSVAPASGGLLGSSAASGTVGASSTVVGALGGFQYTLTDYGQQVAAQNTPAAKMTSGGNYTFDWNQVGKNPTVAINNNGANNSAFFEPDPVWEQFTASDGTPLIGAHGANGFEVHKAIDLSGGWLGNDHESKLNGMPRDYYDPYGKFLRSDTIQGVTDSGVMGPWGALAIIAMAAGAAAAGLGSVSGAGGAAATEAGTAVTAGGGASVSVGADAFEVIAAENAAQTGLLTSAGGSFGTDAFEQIAQENLASSQAAAAATPSTFRPSVDSQMANEQLGITGNQAAADAAAADIPSVTVNGGNSNLLDDLFSNKLLQTLGTKALEMGLGAVGSSLLAPGGSDAGGGAVTAPATPKPLPMPDPLASALDSRRTKVRNAWARHGRQSTILTVPSGRH